MGNVFTRLIEFYQSETNTVIEKINGRYYVSDAYERIGFRDDEDFIDFLAYNIKQMALTDSGKEA